MPIKTPPYASMEMPTFIKRYQRAAPGEGLRGLTNTWACKPPLLCTFRSIATHLFPIPTIPSRFISPCYAPSGPYPATSPFRPMLWSILRHIPILSIISPRLSPRYQSQQIPHYLLMQTPPLIKEWGEHQRIMHPPVSPSTTRHNQNMTPSQKARTR